jgi:hypothetical protein
VSERERERQKRHTAGSTSPERTHSDAHPTVTTPFASRQSYMSFSSWLAPSPPRLRLTTLAPLLRHSRAALATDDAYAYLPRLLNTLTVTTLARGATPTTPIPFLRAATVPVTCVPCERPSWAQLPTAGDPTPFQPVVANSGCLLSRPVSTTQTCRRQFTRSRKNGGHSERVG